MVLDPTLQEIERKSSRGIKWMGIAEIFIRTFQFLTTVVLAHLLLPRDFGVINLALVFIQLAYVVFDLGFSSALIQKKEVSSRHFSTTFVVYLFTAVFFTALIYFLAPYIARFFDHAELVDILRTLTCVFFFFAFSAIPRVQLMRAMRFKRFGSLQALSVFIYGVVTISAAYMGAGVWSFVYGSISEQFSMMLLLYFFAFWKPSLRFDVQTFRELLHFGSNVFGTRLIGYLNANVPNFMIGRMLGATALGYYSIAYQLVEFPVQRISKNVLKVMFPAFSKLQNDPAGYHQLYRKTLYHLALIIFPLFMGILLIAPDFVRFAYGHNWHDAIIPLQILTATGILRSFWATSSVVYLSKGKPRLEFGISLLYSLFLIPALYIAAQRDLITVTITIASVMFMILVVLYIVAIRLVGLPFKDLTKAFRIPLSGSLIMISIGFFLQWLMSGTIAEGIQIGVLVTTGVVIYTIYVKLLDRDIFGKVRQFVQA